MTYQVKNRFQNVPFKRNLQRYSEAKLPPGVELGCSKVGMYNLNSVDPLPITYSLSHP